MLVEATVKNGLPILAKIVYEPAEPAVGLPYPNLYVESLFWRKDERAVTEKIMKTVPESDLDRIAEEVYYRMRNPEY